MLESQREELLSKVRELEKAIHMLEAGNLEAKNQLQLSHYDKEKETREKAYQDGFENGVASIRKDHQIEMTDLRSQHMQKLREVGAEAEARGKAVAKMEIETQVKAFGIKISPYLKIVKQSEWGGMVKNYKSEMGYQYQLMVNGIPAFSPHIVIERAEEYKEIDEKRIELFSDIALKLSLNVAQIYSGAAQGAVTIGSLIKDISAKDITAKDGVTKDVEPEKKDI